MGVETLSGAHFNQALWFDPEERVGALGGTFDPIHRAHLHLADAAAAALQLDRLLLVPAGDPWMKRGRVVTPAAHRYAMVERAAAARGGGLEVVDIELRRAGPSYTLDTLIELRAAGARQLWWILGSDALQSLPRWHQAAALLTKARLAAAARPGSELESHELDRLVPGLGGWVDWVPMSGVDLSASELRGRIRHGQDVSDDIPAAALNYIHSNGLYLSDNG